MVGGFVQKHNVRVARQHLGEKHPEAEASGQRRDWLAVHATGNPQSLQNRRGPCLGSVSIVSLHGFFQFAETLGIEMLLGFGEERLLLDHRIPQFRMTLEGDTQDLLIVIQELILKKDAEPESLGK